MKDNYTQVTDPAFLKQNLAQCKELATAVMFGKVGKPFNNRDEIEATANLISDTKALKTLEISSALTDESANLIALALEKNNSITYLNLYNDDISDRTAANIAKAISKHSNLSVLILPQNKFGDAGARSLADALTKNRSISELRLDHNDITTEGAKALDRAVFNNKNILVATYPNQSEKTINKLEKRNEIVVALANKWIDAKRGGQALSIKDIKNIAERASAIKYKIQQEANSLKHGDKYDGKDILKDFDEDLAEYKKQPSKEEAPKHSKPSRDKHEVETEGLEEETEEEYNYARLVGGSLLGVAGIALLGFAAYSLLGPERGALVFGAGMMKTIEDKMEQIESMTWKELGVTCLCGLAAVGLLGAAVFVIAPEQVRPIFEKILDAIIERTVGTAGMELM